MSEKCRGILFWWLGGNPDTFTLLMCLLTH